MFTPSAFIKHLYVVTLLPSFITLCEPLFCVYIVRCVHGCVCCTMYWYQSPSLSQLSTLDAMYLQWIFTKQWGGEDWKLNEVSSTSNCNVEGDQILARSRQQRSRKQKLVLSTVNQPYKFCMEVLFLLFMHVCQSHSQTMEGGLGMRLACMLWPASCLAGHMRIICVSI